MILVADSLRSQQAERLGADWRARDPSLATAVILTVSAMMSASLLAGQLGDQARLGDQPGSQCLLVFDGVQRTRDLPRGQVRAPTSAAA